MTQPTFEITKAATFDAAHYFAEGPEHRPVVKVVCRLADGSELTEAQAASRRAAEQLAAQQMLERLGHAHA